MGYDTRADRGQSALSAFKADLPMGGRPTTRTDDEAIMVATLLRHAVTTGGSGGRRSLAAARRIAKASLLPWQILDGPTWDDPRSPSPVRYFRLVAEREMRGGAPTLALHILESLHWMTPPKTLESGRILAQRASSAWTGGYRELAHQQYQQVTRLGRQLDNPELIARGLLGVSASVFAAGNVPSAERTARRAIAAARDELPRIVSAGMQTLSIAAALRGDFDTALSLAWRSCKLARGNQTQVEASMVNIAQILVDAGYPAESRAMALQVIDDNKRPMQIIPAIGSYALASAALNDAKAVERAVASLLEHAKAPRNQRNTADALLECSFALEHIGRKRRATQIRARALATASRYGFHDIAYLAEAGMRRGVATHPLATKKSSQAILAELAEFEIEDASLAGSHAG